MDAMMGVGLYHQRDYAAGVLKLDNVPYIIGKSWLEHRLGIRNHEGNTTD